MARLPAPVALVPVVVAISACGDATGPATDPRVSVTVVESSVSIDQSDPALLRIECLVQLRAVNTGTARASWRQARLLVFAGPDRSAPLDSVPISTVQSRTAWGGSDLAPDSTQYSAWHFAAPIPFGVTFVFTYSSPSGDVGSTEVAFACGPDIPPGTAGPAVTEATVEPATAQVESGDTLTVSYAATSEAGLWETIVRFSGGCSATQHHAEQFVKGTRRIEKLAVPAGCQIGGTIAVDVLAVDIAGRAVAARVQSALSLVDRTPPQLVVGFLPGLTPTLQGYFFTGDTLYAWAEAGDNNALSAVFWELWPEGWRDSVRVSQSVFSQYLPFPLGGDAEHRIQVRLYARDAVGLTSDTIVSPPDSLRIYPTVSHPIRTTAIPLATVDVLIDQPRGLLYLRESDARWIKIRALSDLALVDSIALPAPATDFDLSSGGDTLVVTLPALRALGVVDRVVSPRETAVVPLASLDPALDQYPRAVRLAANGKAFVRLDGSTFPATVLLEVDLAAGTERIRTDAGDNGVVGYMAIERSHDHSTLILAGDVGMERYEAGVDSFVARNRAISTFGQRARVDATGARTALSHDVYDAALQRERRVAAPYYDPSIPVALSPDSRVLYHRGPQGVMRSDAETGELLDRTNLSFPIAAMRTTPDGTSLVLYGGGVLGLMDVR